MGKEADEKQAATKSVIRGRQVPTELSPQIASGAHSYLKMLLL